MTNLSHSLVTDLLSDNFEMLHNGDIAPCSISLFYHPNANQEVITALQRIEEKICEELDPDDIYSEPRRYCPWVHQNDGDPGLWMTENNLLIVLQYIGARQRVIELNLDEGGARLHFHKK